MVRETGLHRIEVHVAGMIVRDDADGGLSVLAGKRRCDRKLYSGLWECGGGQVHDGEDFETAVARQMEEEFGVEVKVTRILGTYRIDTDGLVIPGLRFLCKMLNDDAMPVVNNDEFEEGGWLSEKDLEACEFIPGIKEEILAVMKG